MANKKYEKHNKKEPQAFRLFAVVGIVIEERACPQTLYKQMNSEKFLKTNWKNDVEENVKQSDEKINEFSFFTQFFFFLPFHISYHL